MRPESPDRGTDARRDTAVIVVCALLLAAWPVLIALVRRDGAPVGADTPVYVWWTRLVGDGGGSWIAFRPGVPDVTAVIAAVLGVSVTAVVAASGCVCVALAGLAGSAVVRAGGGRGSSPAVALALTGSFSVYLASGHLSNALFAALFVLSLAFLLDGARRGVMAAILLLGAAGLAHPQFLWLAAVILIVAAGLAWYAHERREATATALTVVGGAGVTAAGLVATRIGGPTFDVPTSLDVFLQQTGQVTRLRALFLERFPKVLGYGLWAWVPLALCAVPRLRSRLGRLLIAWLVFTVVAVVVGLVHQPFPPHRIVAFAFCLPLLAALGIDVIAARAPRAALPMTLGVVIVIGVSATMSWLGAPRPFDDPFAAGAGSASAQIGTAPPGPVVIALPPDANLTAVSVIRSTNLLRAAAPPDRIRDLLVRFPLETTDQPDSESLWRASEEPVATALGAGAEEIPLGPIGTSAPPTSPVTELALAVIGWLALCAATGGGWCLVLGLRGVRLVERAPGTGIAALLLVAVAADAIGLRLAERAVAIGVVLAAAGSGWLLAWAMRRPADRPTHPPADTGTAGLRGRLPSLEGPGAA